MSSGSVFGQIRPVTKMSGRFRHVLKMFRVLVTSLGVPGHFMHIGKLPVLL